MELCVNYTSEVKELFEEGKIDFVDYFKLYSINNDLSPFDWCVSQRKVMFHGMLGKQGANIASKDFLQNRDFALQGEYYKRSQCPHISFHLATDKVEGNEEETLSIVADNVEGIRQKYPYPILLENVPAKKEKEDLHFIATPAFIRKALDKTETQFLLDISHAKTAAEALEIPFLEYIKSLPLEKVREIHLSGCERDEIGRWRANHSEMKEEDYELLSFLLQSCPMIRILTLEYGPIDLKTHQMIPTYDKVDATMKEKVYENLLRIKKIMNQ